MREQNDHYGTPAWCTEALLQVHPEIKGAGAFEPCAGTSRIASMLRAHHGQVFASDLVEPPPSLVPWPSLDTLWDLRREDAAEGLRLAARRKLGYAPEWTVTNPPYGALPEILPQLLRLSPGGALLCRLSVLERVASREALLKRVHSVLVLGRIKWIAADGGLIKGTDNVASCWVVWGKGVARRTELRWWGGER